LAIDTTKLSPERAAEEILAFLEREGYVRPLEIAVEMGQAPPQTHAGNNDRD